MYAINAENNYVCSVAYSISCMTLERLIKFSGIFEHRLVREIYSDAGSHGSPVLTCACI